jgi:type IV pilus assembly protein PilA
MTTACRNNKGFTLIELLIVVAVIGILAAIAIPFFKSYRVKTFNVAAVTDMRGAKLMLEAYYSDQKYYP